MSIRFTSEFSERRIDFPDGSHAFYHGNVWPNLEAMRSKIKYKHQNVIMVTGRTGTGKSEFAIQLAKALDPNFTIDNIFWNTEDLIKVAANKDNVKPPGTAFIFDEAREGTQSLNAMTETNRRMGLFLDTIRSRGYHIFLLQPSYFLFQKSIAIYAADILFHIEKKGNVDFYNALKEGKFDEENPHEPFERGYGKIFDVEQKKALYIKGKRMEDMDAAPSTLFNFRKSHGIIDWDEYERRKTIAVAAMNEAFEKESAPKLSSKAERLLEWKRKVYHYMNIHLGIPVSQISTAGGDDTTKVYEYINDERRRIEKMLLENKTKNNDDREDREQDDESIIEEEADDTEDEY